MPFGWMSDPTAHIHGARQRRELRSIILDSNAASLRFHSYALFIPCQSSMYQVKSFLSLVSCKNFIFLEGCDMLNGNRKGTSASPASYRQLFSLKLLLLRNQNLYRSVDTESQLVCLTTRMFI